MAPGTIGPETGKAIDWTPKRLAMDPHAFDCARYGPYCVGPQVRGGKFGAVNLALRPGCDRVLEVERILVQGDDDQGGDGVGARLLEQLNHCVGLIHPHIALIEGAGMQDGCPYIVRGHVLGRTLSDLVSDGFAPPPEVVAGIVYSVAQGLYFLGEAGPEPTTCLVGGVDEELVLLGWDGSIRLLGAGFAFLRGARDQRADIEALGALAARLDLDVAQEIDESAHLHEASVRIRKRHPEACARRQQLVGGWLRREDGEGCDAFRRFFGLEVLQ